MLHADDDDEDDDNDDDDDDDDDDNNDDDYYLVILHVKNIEAFSSTDTEAVIATIALTDATMIIRSETLRRCNIHRLQQERQTPFWASIRVIKASKRRLEF